MTQVLKKNTALRNLLKVEQKKMEAFGELTPETTEEEMTERLRITQRMYGIAGGLDVTNWWLS